MFGSVVIEGRRVPQLQPPALTQWGEEREKQISLLYPACKGRNQVPVTQMGELLLSMYYVPSTTQGTEDPEIIRA